MAYQTSLLAGVGGCGSLWWVRPLLENCIVDASIFEFFQDRSTMIAGEGFTSGGVGCRRVCCLGFCDCSVAEVFKGTLVDALALGAEEGRCSLR